MFISATSGFHSQQNEFTIALGFCDRTSWANCEERKRERERKPTRCNNQMFIINAVSTCFGHHYAHLQENKRLCVTACGVLRWFCWMWLVAVVGRCVVGCEHCEGYSHPKTQRPTIATNHIQQNQRNTPHAVTHCLCSPEDRHNDARNMSRQRW